eukprot:CAMPEP_0184494596 /NCGR_PEP_ID=MMETSP0113_2-20130426/29098_1 /TAXON_ID=91329 /ORGANISM="Norrisiella sphaerica, Strain BC52" /LENGTH=746 /DNA_ID=CAMNT_0026880413 /DNA_START=134 /DNA_END=2371 /DNA_ORIENTATION=-
MGDVFSFTQSQDNSLFSTVADPLHGSAKRNLLISDERNISPSSLEFLRDLKLVSPDVAVSFHGAQVDECPTSLHSVMREWRRCWKREYNAAMEARECILGIITVHNCQVCTADGSAICDIFYGDLGYAQTPTKATAGCIVRRQQVLAYNSMVEGQIFLEVFCREGILKKVEANYDCQELKIRSLLQPDNCFLSEAEFKSKWTQPNPKVDFFITSGSAAAVSPGTHSALVTELDRIGASTCDFFGSQYQNIIDPNLNVCPPPSEYFPKQGSGLPSNEHLTWLADECIVDVKKGSVILDGLGPFSREQSSKLITAMEGLLSAAMPAVFRLKRPQVMPATRMQVVIKAQRIIIKPGDTYEGLWHREQRYEHITAVALYYYNYGDLVVKDGAEGEDVKAGVTTSSVSQNYLQGGDLEFLPRDTNSLLDPWDIRQARLEGEVRAFMQARVRAKLKKGTLLVFSNYQLIHRVLRCKNKGNVPLSRDFVAIYFVDQAHPLPSQAVYRGITRQLSDTISSAFRTTRTSRKRDAQDKAKSPCRMAVSETLIDIILQYMSAKFSHEQRRAVRASLVMEHLTPAGSFGITKERCYTTGNGSPHLVGWLDQIRDGRGKDGDSDDIDDAEEIDNSSFAIALRKYGLRTPNLGRGLSALGDHKAFSNNPADVLSSEQKSILGVSLRQAFVELAGEGCSKLQPTTLRRRLEEVMTEFKGLTEVESKNLREALEDLKEPLDYEAFCTVVLYRLVAQLKGENW